MLTRAYAHSEWQPEYWLSIGRTAASGRGTGHTTASSLEEATACSAPRASASRIPAASAASRSTL